MHLRTRDHDICHCPNLGGVSQPEPPVRGVHTTWVTTLGSLVFMIAVLMGISLLLLVDVLAVEPHPVQVATVLAMLAASALAIRFCWFLRVGLGGGLPHPAWTTALLLTASTAWVLGLWAPGAALVAAVPLVVAGTLVAALLPRNARIGITVVVLAAAGAHAMLGAELAEPTGVELGGPVRLVALYTAGLPIMVFSSVWWWEIVVTLDRHRRAAGELAVAEERLRFAADLHDIQGHHLQVIALKAELAERLLERDPASAREQLRETRLIAKQALEETRSLVAGYRGVDLDAELENARDVLELSGAECTLDVDGLPADAEVRRVLALAVREATTNILRHSSATRAAIRISTGPDGVTLAIVNDGSHERTGGDSTSSGLAGLRERVAAIGGTVDDALIEGEFRLDVRVPAAVEVHA